MKHLEQRIDYMLKEILEISEQHYKVSLRDFASISESIDLDKSAQPYLEALYFFSESKEKLFFDNSGRMHCNATSYVIFDSIEERVRIYANNISEYSSNFPLHLKGFKTILKQHQKKKIIQIIVDTNPFEDTSSEIANYIKRNKIFFEGTLEFRQATIQFKKSIMNLAKRQSNPSIPLNCEQFYFVLGDDRMIKIEDDSEKRKTLGCSFNYPELVSLYGKEFDTNWKLCELIPIPN